MNQQERRDFIEQIIREVNIYEDKTPEGQWIKSVKFRLPLITEDISIGLDKDDHVESCVLLERVSNRKADSYVKLNVKMADYYRIKDSAETEKAEE